MNPALVLIDLQEDYLRSPALQPARGAVVAEAARLLEACRRRRLPIVHVLTTVHRRPDDRMPHWKRAELWQCVEGTAGHRSPPSVAPTSGETVISKRFFSAFGTGELDQRLRSMGCDTVILAGVHLHACIRTAALDAYERGYSVWIARDAVASDDPLHAAITERYLETRAAAFASTPQLVSLLDGERLQDGATVRRSPADESTELWRIGTDHRATIEGAAMKARQAAAAWRARDPQDRGEVLRKWGEALAEESQPLARMITTDIGKPISMARAELRRSVELLNAAAVAASPARESLDAGAGRIRHAPLGVVAVITPYNNPVAIPAGKIGPALVYGNTVVWKPAPAAAKIAERVLEIATRAGVPSEALVLCGGDRRASLRLAESVHVDGVTISGSLRAGYAIQDVCARRHVPFQAELGGNNAAIVWEDADLPMAAARIAAGAFGFAGQRCTANRRVIVAESCFEEFVSELERATAGLRWGDPMNPDTVVGPLIDVAKRDGVSEIVRRAEAAGCSVLSPHRSQVDCSELMERGAYFPPTIVLADDASGEIVQEESFGPVVVVQRAASFDHALDLCNGVRQGLVAALFSSSSEKWARFVDGAQAGILKWNQSTVEADAISPFGGWKASGTGPAEHGPCDREFYCRVQTLYGTAVDQPTRSCQHVIG